MQARLEIYVEGSCENCQAALSIAEQLRGLAPAVQVSVIDLGQEPHRRPERVFAVPTYLLNGEIFSLGNPRLEDLLAALQGIDRNNGTRGREVWKTKRFKG
jgi:alkyl hydroperoxide reductase subunit AhpF